MPFVIYFHHLCGSKHCLIAGREQPVL